MPDSRSNAILRLVLFGLLLGLISAPPVFTAVNKNRGEYKGRRFVPAESASVATAIDEIGKIADDQPDPHMVALIHGMEACLREMLEKGTLCAEAGKTNNRGYTDDGKERREAMVKKKEWSGCKWAEDRINIQPNLITSDKSTAKYWELVSVLIHESRHAVQWEITPPPVGNPGSTPTNGEWDPYAWETWSLCKSLTEEGLAVPESLKLAKSKKLAKWRRDWTCNNSIPKITRSDSFMVCQKRVGSAGGGNVYQNADDRSQILIDDGLVEHTIQTPYTSVLDFDIEPDMFGGDVLVVCGSNSTATSGGAAMYYDNTFDGVPDQATETILGILTKPTSVDMEPSGGILAGRLFVFDSAANEVYFATLDFEGRPMPLNPLPFADALTFPFLADMYSLISIESDPIVASRSASSVHAFEVLLSPDPDEFDFSDRDRIKYVLTDLNQDGAADGSTVLDSVTKYITFQPTIINDPQAGDTTIIAAGLGTSTLRVHVTDLYATFLGEQLAEVVVPSVESAVGIKIPLNRPLVQGERIVVADITTGERETKSELVHGVRPEIFTTDLPNYVPGDTIFVEGRYFAPSSSIMLSGQLMATTNYVSDSLMTMIAPNLSLTPTNSFLLTVSAGADTSRFIAVYIMADCNNNGVDDIVDIQTGLEVDANENSIPDACEPITGAHPRSPVSAFALHQNVPNPFNPTTTIRYEVKTAGQVELAVYDVTGALVRVLYRDARKPGTYDAEWNGLSDRGQSVASGVYFYRLRTAGDALARKMVLLK